MNPFLKLMLFIVILICFKFTRKFLSPKEIEIKESFKEQRLKYGLASRHFLSNKLSDREFESCCAYFLINDGYSNITHVSEDFKGGLSLICNEHDDSKIYVSCIKSSHKENNLNDDYDTVGRPELQKLIGIMIHDKVYKAIVITTGNFSSDAKKYVEQLSSEYNIQLIDGISLSRSMWKIRENNIQNLSIENLVS